MTIVATAKKYQVAEETVVRWLKVNGVQIRSDPLD